MKKIAVIVLLGFLLIILMARLLLFNWQNFFRHNILDPIPASVADFKYQKDFSAMHGAMAFSFKADSADLNLIIERNNLKRYQDFGQMPEIVKDVLERIFKNIKWWPSSTDLKTKKIYGLLEQTEYEPYALFFFVNADGKIYGMKL